MASLVKGTAFITGAASGIGKYTALAFAKYGISNLSLTDVNKDALEEFEKELNTKYPNVKVITIQLDVQKIDAVKAAIAETVKTFGRLDIALNNAGIAGENKMTHEVTEEEWRQVVNINLDGVWRCQKEELAVMVKQDDLGPREGRGRIINTASMYGVVGPGNGTLQAAYAAAKHGVIGLTRNDGNAYGPQGIRINAICPGYVETPLLKLAMEEGQQGPLAQDIQRTPLRRLCTMEEIADSIVFLASPMSSFMQGAAMVADGGFSTV